MTCFVASETHAIFGGWSDSRQPTNLSRCVCGGFLVMADVADRSRWII